MPSHPQAADLPALLASLCDSGVEFIVVGGVAAVLWGVLIDLVEKPLLFTGDHLWATDDQTGLEAGRDVCWYSWSEQRASIARLAGYSFTHVLPGHGRRFTTPDAETMRAAVLRAAA